MESLNIGGLLPNENIGSVGHRRESNFITSNDEEEGKASNMATELWKQT